ncbi:hypothetical protein C8F04DRAFT_1135468 [Mycena alexandri]|uniref:Uncharacterized protein n=1 Tax=Mycena alexandri TaxID=1745969 RepID=A0AAD6WRX4_9AGAR|nr:hypothetical protein C8F04DRAFT_1135468 [Mycena alexandri]
MQNSDTTDTNASTSPLSPFSSFEVPSEPTSDELPDLGAFTTVLRAWTHLQPPPRTFMHHPDTDTTTTTTGTDYSYHESEDLPGSTVWTHRPIASYLDSLVATTDPDAPSPSPRTPSPGSGSNTEGGRTLLEDLDLELDEEQEDGQDEQDEQDPGEYELSDLEDDDDIEQPSLGLLDGALSFVA